LDSWLEDKPLGVTYSVSYALTRKFQCMRFGMRGG
jgi:hypothetical protein